ncbi:hypothetical protein ACSBR1_040817 [Camellia fascicularis]
MGNETSKSEADKDVADCKIYLPKKDEQDGAPKYMHENIDYMARRNCADADEYISAMKHKLKKQLEARHLSLKQSGKSCKLIWLCYLRPDIKRGNISPLQQNNIFNNIF